MSSGVAAPWSMVVFNAAILRRSCLDSCVRLDLVSMVCASDFFFTCVLMLFHVSPQLFVWEASAVFTIVASSLTKEESS